MKLNRINGNMKFLCINSLFINKNNIVVISSLILFTAITNIFILFICDLFVNELNLQTIKDFLFMLYGTNTLNVESTQDISIKEYYSYNNKVSIFSTFIDLFNKSSSTFKYFPSHFQSSPPYLFINQSDLIVSNITLIDTISYNQYLILEQYNSSLNNLLNDICNILLEYSQGSSI
jgi:hypothetical protein